MIADPSTLGGVARYTVLVDSMGERSTTTAIMTMVQIDGNWYAPNRPGNINRNKDGLGRRRSSLEVSKVRRLEDGTGPVVE